MKETFVNIKKVYSNWKYLVLAIGVGIGFYIFNSLLTNISFLSNTFSNQGLMGTIKFYAIIASGYHHTILMTSFISLVLISILVGVLFTLILYKQITFKKGNMGVMSVLGLSLGAIAPGCAACGLGLASALGFGAVLATVLPYDGLEISFLAIGLLGYSILKTSKNLNSCKIKL